MGVDLRDDRGVGAAAARGGVGRGGRRRGEVEEGRRKVRGGQLSALQAPTSAMLRAACEGGGRVRTFRIASVLRHRTANRWRGYWPELPPPTGATGLGKRRICSMWLFSDRMCIFRAYSSKMSHKPRGTLSPRAPRSLCEAEGGRPARSRTGGTRGHQRCVRTRTQRALYAYSTTHTDGRESRSVSQTASAMPMVHSAR